MQEEERTMIDMEKQTAEKEFSFDLKRVHKANLEILKAIRTICDKHNITYLLDAGTLLGAVRHRGFIPWDDDIDLAFRREEFEKFKAIANCELPEEMQLIMPDEYRKGNAFYDFVPRVIYKKSRRHNANDEDQKFYEGKLNHLWVDLFIIDRLPDGKLSSRIARLKQQIVFGLGMGHRRMLDWSKYKGLSFFEVKVLSGIGRMLPMPFLFRLQDKWAREYTEQYKKKSAERFEKNGGKGKSFYSNYQPDYQYCILDDEWEEPTEFEFEGSRFKGPREWDKVLKMLYGDYMKLPKEEDRHPSHSGMEIEVFD